MSTTPVDPNTSAAVYQALNATSTKSASSSDATTDLQNRFLTLLTAQLKNQDPLNPLDNSQMTSQLAQISTVDGISQLNTTLQALVSNSSDSQALQAAALVGKPVLVPGTGLSLANGQALGGVELASAADDVVATIRNASGLTVRTLDLGAMNAGTNGFQWDGTTDDNVPAVDGSYTMSFAAKQAQNTVAATALQLGVVSSVSRSTQGVNINVGTLGMFNISDVKQIL
jgi:flagellar basal-body rod modification protein FlgD